MLFYVFFIQFISPNIMQLYLKKAAIHIKKGYNSHN